MFVVGLLTGGVLSSLVLGLASGLFAPMPLAWRHGVIILVALLGLLWDAGAVPIRLPQNTRQVPQDVLQRNLLRGATQFGFELGTGVRTYVSASAPYVLAVAVLLAGQYLGVAILAGLGFGAGRAATPLVRFAAGATADAAAGWDVRLRARLRAITMAGVVAMAAAFGLLFW
jgi:hypothetical protein